MKFCLFSTLITFLPPILAAQDQTTTSQSDSADSVKPAPVVTGGMAFNTTFSPGVQTLSPTINPLFLVPLGNRFLLEGEVSLSSDLEHNSGVWGPKVFNKEVEYLQLDYTLNPGLTVVVGRILTPFGIYLERYHPEWIRDLQVAPIIFGISHNQSMGAELRGATHLTRGVDLTYTGFYAVNSTAKYFDGQRGGGGRASLFFSGPRLELGFSYNRRLGDQRFNLFAWDATWNARAFPLDLRSEVFKTGTLGCGYWLEAAYRLNKVSHNAFLRRSQLVVRGEQYFAPMQSAMAGSDAMSMGSENYLPDRNTTRPMAGWNYYLTDAVKLSFAFGRSFATSQNQNIYSAGVTFRFGLAG